MPGTPSSRRSRSTGGVITPRSSAISGELAELARARPRRPPRPARAASGPRGRCGRARGHRPVRDEAAEVVDALQVGELGGTPQALDPPAVALAAQRAPVVERIAPELAGRRSSASGGAPATKPRWKSSGCARWSALRGADVERDVADQPHAALARVARAARSTRARSAPGRRRRRRPAKRSQSPIQ